MRDWKSQTEAKKMCIAEYYRRTEECDEVVAQGDACNTKSCMILVFESCMHARCYRVFWVHACASKPIMYRKREKHKSTHHQELDSCTFVALRQGSSYAGCHAIQLIPRSFLPSLRTLRRHQNIHSLKP